MKKLVFCFLGALLALATAASAAEIPPLGWPVAKETTAVVHPFGWESPKHVGTLNRSTSVSVGVDLATAPAEGVVAAADGTVLKVFAAIEQPLLGPKGTIPGYVVLQHTDANGEPYTTFYYGLATVEVAVGAAVAKGQELGDALGTSVHFGVRNSAPVPAVSSAAAYFITTYFGPSASRLNKVTFPDSWADPLPFLE